MPNSTVVKNSKNNYKKTNLVHSFLLYGKHAVESALLNPKRKISALWCTAENALWLRDLLLQAHRDKITLKIVDKKELDKMLPQDAVHQGVVLETQPLPNVDLTEVICRCENNPLARILVLDQVSDPQNIGAIIRSCAAFNISALIMQDKNSPQESGAMVKASAGTIEFLPVCRVTNLSRALETLKQNGFWCIGMDGYAKHSIDKINKNAKIAVVMGSEGKGLRRLVQDNCDDTVKLLINPNVESLNVSVAAAIALYELSKF